MVAPYASVTNENSIIRGKKKVPKIWEVYFLTHQQSNDFNGCLKMLPIAASLAICEFVLLLVYVSVFPALCSSYFFQKKRFAYADDVLLSFPPSNQNWIQIPPQPHFFFSLPSYLINPIGGLVFILYSRLDVCCVCSEHM